MVRILLNKILDYAYIIIFKFSFSQCIAGCLKCSSKNCTTPVCEWSEWSDWSNCTDKCNGESKRYRNLFGVNCYKNETQEQTQKCNDCRCQMNQNFYEVINF